MLPSASLRRCSRKKARQSIEILSRTRYILPSYFKEIKSVFCRGPSPYKCRVRKKCAAGYYLVGGRSVPCYWTNGAPAVVLKDDLGNPLTGDARVNAIAVSDGNVYTGGYYKDEWHTAHPCYWKGEIRTALFEDGGNGAIAQALCVSGDTVYAAGYHYSNTGIVPCYWEGANRFDLPGPATMGRGSALAIYVSGSTVYTAGYYATTAAEIACTWIDHAAYRDLPGDGDPTHDAEAVSVFAAGETVYAAGFYKNGAVDVPCVWTGTVRQDLPGGDAGHYNGRANAVFGQ
jgi:hypothetical protein